MELSEMFLDSLNDCAGYDREAFIEAHHNPQIPVSIRLHPCKRATEYQFQFLNQVPWADSGVYLKKRPAFILDPIWHAGGYYVQEASSMFLEQAIKQTVSLSQPILALDLCAAPGGKTTHLLSLLHPESLLVSNEMISSRMHILKENVTKWGVPQIVVTQNKPIDFGKVDAMFDLMIVDAPCSGSGLFRKDANAFSEWHEDSPLKCAIRQQKILSEAWPCLKSEGVLIYATCSYSEVENEHNVDWIMQHLDVENLTLKLNPDWHVVETNTPMQAKGYRFWPDKLSGEGFFISVFKKKEHSASHKLHIKGYNLPAKSEISAAQSWLKKDLDLTFIYQCHQLAAVPKNWLSTILFLQQHFNVKYVGVEVGKVMHHELIPEHALAISVICDDHTPIFRLNDEQALQYIRKQNFEIDTNSYKGWALVAYQNLGLGWIKQLGNRMNNYFPKQLRVLK